MFSERDWSQEAQGLGELYTEFVWIGGRAECRNKKIYRGQRSWQGLGHGGENARYSQSKNWTNCPARVGTLQKRQTAKIM